MKVKFKRVWLKALRGKLKKKYIQYQGKLSRDGKFCCLGVIRHCTNPKDSRSLKHRNGLLNYTQLKEFGLSMSGQKTLARMNDYGKSFEKIADYIEKRF